MTMTVLQEQTIDVLRPAQLVLSGTDMNGAWATRHSFARTMLRRAASRQWTVQKTRIDLDAQGRGTVVYSIDAEGRQLHFVAFCRTLEESERTDRVIAVSWDVTAALVEGELTPGREADLRLNIPVQERGRVDPGVIIMTRANRSARFFDYVSDALASGRQPEVGRVGPSPYLIRSTAFYGNGKFGLKAFSGFPAEHPLAVPYRSQMLAAWLLRELSCDMVEHVARAKAAVAGTEAATLDSSWGRYLGLGNATGLGMVPFVVNHPDYLDAWCRLREVPLAAGLSRAYAPDERELGLVAELLVRADRHLAEKDGLKTEPFLPASLVRPQLHQLLEDLLAFISSDQDAAPVLARLHDKAGQLSPEARGIFASIVCELRSDFDQDVEAFLTTLGPEAFDAGMSCGALRSLLQAKYGWVQRFNFDSPESTRYLWFSSEANEEPRRALRHLMRPETVEHCTDVARRVSALAADLGHAPAGQSLAAFLRERPGHRFAAARVQQTSRYVYGELTDNLLDETFLPLSTQRFQLACYGMNNFSPQSTDWLRVTLFSGAPRVSDVNDGTATDDWLFPTAPEGPMQ